MLFCSFLTDHRSSLTEPKSHGSHNKTQTLLPVTVAGPRGCVCLPLPTFPSTSYNQQTGDRTRSLHGPYVSADHKMLKPLLGRLEWNWKQEPVTAAAIASFGWVCRGSVGKAQSDGSAHADLLTAAGCRRLMSCCHSASSSLSWPPSGDVFFSLFQVCKCDLHVYVITESS